jgi:subtilisin-like proprotein convertase family protein
VLNSGQSASYTFATQGDFCAFGDHNLNVHTFMPTDMDPTNDNADATITNIPCTSTIDATTQTIGPSVSTMDAFISIPYSEVITDVNVRIKLYHSNDEDLDIYLTSPQGVQVELTTDNGGNGFDYINTIFDDAAGTSITSGTAPFTNTYQPEGNLSDFNGLNSLGLWTLSVTDDTSNGQGGTFIEWELDVCFNPFIGIYENTIDSDDLKIATFDNNQYEISLTAQELSKPLLISIFDIKGQVLAENWVFKEDNLYKYHLDMSYVSPGVYLIKINNIVKRILVK